MTETKTITVKITPRALALVRRIVAKTGEKQYAVFERLAENEMEIHTKRKKAVKA